MTFAKYYFLFLVAVQFLFTAGCGPSAAEIERQRVLTQGREIISELDVACSQGVNLNEFSEKSQKVLAFLQANKVSLGEVSPEKLLKAIDVTLKMWDAHLKQPTYEQLLGLSDSQMTDAIAPVIDAQVAIYSLANNGVAPDDMPAGIKANGFDTSTAVAKGMTLVSDACEELLQQLQPSK